ncbi:MAG: DNA gyrase/topoisomerase IV subunit A [Capnocytophaga sp.]|nr:DNA gyrase/topoisomerase IV subunit A [Capnocytophaga sp.]
MEENALQPSGESILKITGMYENWFLDYASYVILERAVPTINDGFKPVQRRIMHSMKELDDGRYNKVANVVGHTMQYHPHGDASIGDAMVQLGQKDLLIDTQGNWGNILTGDSAAAPRYIEARLSKFALDVVFSPKVTEWQASYDGRKKEPINLPVKFPLLLAQGTEGIAVGLSTKIMPHNFIELIDASIKYLKNKPFELFPDFPTAGIMDVTNYNDGERGGKVRVRAKINQIDKSTLCITEIPFTTTTTSLIDSILKANDKGKIKIKKVDDNTSADVEILIHLPAGISPDKTIDALYAFTACETSISPLACIIEDNKPLFLTVSEILRRSTDNTVGLLKQELEVELAELEEQWHYTSLEKIFFEEKIYKELEEKHKSWDEVLSAIDTAFDPFKPLLRREVTREDITKLTEKPVRRIYRLDIQDLIDQIKKLEDKIDGVKHHLANLIDFAIEHFKRIKDTYGKGRERKTEIRPFDDIEATKVVIRNTKLYMNRAEGFVGTSLKKDEYIGDCSDIDDVIAFAEDGTMVVFKVAEKTYVRKNLIHVAVFKKDDKRTIYNMIYKDGNTGVSYIKRFNVTAITREREYELIPKHKDSKVLYFSANPNGEAEIVTVNLRNLGTTRRLKWDINFADTLIKTRTAKGNQVSKFAIKRIDLKEKGVSTLKPRKIWFDDIVMRLNTDERGRLLGAFKGDDRLLLIAKDGTVRTVIPDLNLHFDNSILVMEKWLPEKPISVIYFDGEKERSFVKRFVVENENREETVITDHPKSTLLYVNTDWRPMAEVIFAKERGREIKENITVNLEEFIAVKGIKALGNQLAIEKIKEIKALEPLPYEEVLEEEITDEIGDEEAIPTQPDPSENQTELEF